jgi:hypothetical protein
MISALLLPLLVSDVPAKTAGTPQDDPPIQVWISNDRRFLPGDRAKVQVRTDYDGYLIVLHVDPEGRLRVLFPVDPDKDNFVRSGKKYEVRDRGDREAFEVDATGRGSVYAAVSRDPFRFDGLTISDHWDYRAMAPARLREDPEPELNELVQRMAQGSYDYDVLSYEVISRSAYVSSSRYYGSLYDDDWCSFSCGRPYYGYSPFRLSIGFFYGRPYRNYYYDPYYYAYDPYYNPFFYDPYYYAPAYYPRYVYPRRYYGYGSPYYHDRYRTYNRPYTPYRFRGSDGFSAGYRDRRHDLRRAVNTVYTPPVSRIREPAAQPVVRRVTDDGADLPNGLAPRRVVGHETRVQPKPIEGRRARQPETAREATPARRDADNRPVIRREQPRAERTREAPRSVERARDEPRRVERSPAPEARPQRREAERSSPPPQVRSSGRAESRGGGGGGRPEGGGSRPSNTGGARRR